MDPFFEAVSSFRRRNYDKCIEKCSAILDITPLDQAAWVLKMRALTQRVYIDDIDADDGGIADDALDSSAVASTPRPGTSLRTAVLATGATGRGTATARPRTSTGRAITGIARPGTNFRPGTTLVQTIRTARTATGTARALRLGTASMLSQRDGPFIQISRLNLGKYADLPHVAKPLFQYLYYHEGNTRMAMELCAQATRKASFEDWWWKAQLGKCYLAMGLPRDAEQQLRSALKQRPHVETTLLLAKVFVRIDQPLSALDVCRLALEEFPNEGSLLTEQARLLEALDNLQASVRMYRQNFLRTRILNANFGIPPLILIEDIVTLLSLLQAVICHATISVAPFVILILAQVHSVKIAQEDAMNTEALACIAVHHFYNDQPEIALRYYRRILSMGVFSAELFNNIALCCLLSQQLDLTLACFQRALQLATAPEQRAEVWYNLSFVAVSSGDLGLTRRCLRLCISSNSSHGAALNNLAVIEQWVPNGTSNETSKGRSRSYIAAALASIPDAPEIVHNANLLNML